MSVDQAVFSFSMEVAKQIVKKMYPRLKNEETIEERAKGLLTGELEVDHSEVKSHERKLTGKTTGFLIEAPRARKSARRAIILREKLRRRKPTKLKPIRKR